MSALISLGTAMFKRYNGYKTNTIHTYISIVTVYTHMIVT